jgi:hypothetical protein
MAYHELPIRGHPDIGLDHLDPGPDRLLHCVKRVVDTEAPSAPVSYEPQSSLLRIDT